MTIRTKKNEALQGLRALSFVAIFLYHCGIGHLAVMGVSFFFVLSGFLMVYNNIKKNIAAISLTVLDLG